MNLNARLPGIAIGRRNLWTVPPIRLAWALRRFWGRHKFGKTGGNLYQKLFRPCRNPIQLRQQHRERRRRAWLRGIA